MAVKDISDEVALLAIQKQDLDPAYAKIASSSGQPIKVAKRKLEQLKKRGMITDSGSFPILTDLGRAVVDSSVELE